MAFDTVTRTAPSALALEVSAFVHHTVQALNDYRLYRATVRELSRLDGATLADLGLSRSGIRAEARKAVYGF